MSRSGSGHLEELADPAGSVEQGRLEEVLRDRLPGGREQDQVGADAAPDRDEQEPPQHRGHTQERCRVRHEPERVFLVDQPAADEQAVE